MREHPVGVSRPVAGETRMNNILYLIGAVVVIVVVLRLLGLF